MAFGVHFGQSQQAIQLSIIVNKDHYGDAVGLMILGMGSSLGPRVKLMLISASSLGFYAQLHYADQALALELILLPLFYLPPSSLY
jgi:hypothetical protein